MTRILQPNLARLNSLFGYRSRYTLVSCHTPGKPKYAVMCAFGGGWRNDSGWRSFQSIQGWLEGAVAALEAAGRRASLSRAVDWTQAENRLTDRFQSGEPNVKNRPSYPTSD